MGCGCKGKKPVEPVVVQAPPSNINLSEVLGNQPTQQEPQIVPTSNNPS